MMTCGGLGRHYLRLTEPQYSLRSTSTQSIISSQNQTNVRLDFPLTSQIQLKTNYQHNIQATNNSGCLVAGLHCLSKIGECQARTTYNVQCKIRNTFNQRESDTQQRDRQSQPTSLHLALNISIILYCDFQTQTPVSDNKYLQGGHFKWHGISHPTGVRYSLRCSPHIYPAYLSIFYCVQTC